MSIESRCTMGAMASKKARSASPVSPRTASASAGDVNGPVAMITLSQSLPAAGRRFPRAPRFTSGCAARSRRDGPGEAVAVDGERAAGRHLMGVGGRHDQRAHAPHFAMQHSDRIGLGESSERKEFEQTSSARPSVR
jgi:hypothetical protein